jgi:hypothetical protein
MGQPPLVPRETPRPHSATDDRQTRQHSISQDIHRRMWTAILALEPYRRRAMFLYVASNTSGPSLRTTSVKVFPQIRLIRGDLVSINNRNQKNQV